MKWTLSVGFVLGVCGAVAACSSDSGGGGNGGAAGGGTGGSAAAAATGGTGNVGGGGTAGTGGTTGPSCQGHCGSPDPVGTNPECYCDPACESPQNNDCCADYTTVCGGGGTGGTTSGGKCVKFCCAASDCASGETCKAFDSANGTLGICMAGSGGAGGTSGAGGTAGAAGSASGGAAGSASGGAAGSASGGAAGSSGGGAGGAAGSTSIQLPAGCVTGGVIVNCNPLTNEGCDGASGAACDYGTDSNQQQALICFPDGNVTPAGGDCANQGGPYCQPTLHCSG